MSIDLIVDWNPEGSTTTSSPGSQHPGGDLAGVAAVVAVLGGLGADHVLHREAHVDQVAVAREVHRLEVVEQRRSLVPRHVGGAVDDVVAVERRDRDERDVVEIEAGGELGELGADLVEAVRVVVDEVHLVDADDEVRHAEQRDEQAVAAGLLDDAVTGVDEHDRQVGGRRSGDHVARVLDVARAVGDDELALGGREVAVGDVDRDALLPLGAEPVGEEGQVDVVVAAPPADGLDVFELVLEDRFRVVQEASDQGRLAVVDAADGGEAQRRDRMGHQK